ncbi:hypothetical protein HYX12_04760 [Candidatus Woesearchaeota archaeon]|nr:hypothetical protein [Candidatus Woesearchaeota archaeon]
MQEKIVFRTIIEVLGKPKEHVEKALQGYIQKLKKDKDYKVIKESFAEVKKREKEELWATFVELEVETENTGKIFNFCFDYMPSMIEVIRPKELFLEDLEISMILSDLQAKLHSVDMVAKEVKAENDFLKKNMAGLLKNYITTLLKGRPGLTSDQISFLTGVPKGNVEDYLDVLIDEGKVDLNGKLYALVEKNTN